ncbi:MAG: hypothetical protein AB7I19_03885 [Planctomycetota bacterium]
MRCFLPALLALAIAPAASADRFYLGTAETAAKFTHGNPDFIQGVLLSETATEYVIRVEGGEVTLAKSAVWKVEADGLTAETLQKIEADKAPELARANQARRSALGSWHDSWMSRVREARATEASAQRVGANVSEATASTVRVGYDPVLDVAIDNAVGSAVSRTVQRELGGVIRPAVERELRDVRRNLRDALRR